MDFLSFVQGWPAKIAKLARDWGAAFVVVERNKIGDTGVALIKTAIKFAGLTGKVEIREAYSFKDKGTRALPVGTLYERNKVHHAGRFPELESQLTQHEFKDGQASPNNLDAFVHVAIELKALADDEDDKPSPKGTLASLERANAGFGGSRWGDDATI